MAGLTLADLSKKMADIDFCMLLTHSEGGEIAGRPMSNNQDVEYDGDSWFFSLDDTRTIRDIFRYPKVALSYQGSKGLLGGPGFMMSIEGMAEVLRDKALFEAHWNKDLEIWFEQGVDTPGLVLIKVHATRIHYWHGKEEGELTL
jgi:general stress protein 26